jgi:hypothetical protein
LTCDRSSVSINFGKGTDLGLASPLIEALDWLCKAIRNPGPDHGLTYSTATYRLVRREISAPTEGSHPSAGRASHRYILRPCINLQASQLPKLEHDCWQLLLDSCIVTDSALTEDRPFGKGLESSFDLMISLAAAEFHLVIQGGVVFVGYQTVLVPTAIHGNCAQFHLITNAKGQINPYTLDLGQRALTEDPSQFERRRCFLGWCEVAQINLGTKHLPANVGYSGGRDKGKTLILDGLSANLQVGASSPLSAVLGLQTNFKYKPNRLQFTPLGGYCKLLQDTAKEIAIVYDAVQQRCWLVPKLSLLLHMSHAYALGCVDVPGDRIPFVEAHNDAVDIVQILAPLGEMKVYGENNDALLFRHLMLGLNTNLLGTILSLEKSRGKKFYGFEFMDVVTQPGRGSCMKKLKILPQGRNWLDIVNAVDAVVVCSDLGPAITAMEQEGRACPECNNLPMKFDYLAATLPCLARLVERKGGRMKPVDKFCRIKISEDSFWDLTGDPFQACGHSERLSGTCWERNNMIQRLDSEIFFKALMSLRECEKAAPERFPAAGAVVFGERRC